MVNTRSNAKNQDDGVLYPRARNPLRKEPGGQAKICVAILKNGMCFRQYMRKLPSAAFDEALALCLECGNSIDFKKNFVWTKYQDEIENAQPAQRDRLIKLCNTCGDDFIRKIIKDKMGSPKYSSNEEDNSDSIIYSTPLTYPDKSKNFVFSPESGTLTHFLTYKKIYISGIVFFLIAIIVPFIIRVFTPVLYASHKTYINTTPQSLWRNISSDVENYLERAKNVFRIQNDDLWYDVLGGLKDSTSDPFRPAVFSLMHNDDIQTTSCIAKIITDVGNKYIFQRNNWLLLNGNKLRNDTIADYGDLYDKIIKKISVYNILIVNNLQDIPGNLARMFQFLCETYNSPIKKAMYILIINTKNYKSIENPMELAEEVLRDAWKDLEPDILSPLITRVTSIPLKIDKVNNINACSLETPLSIEIDPN